MRCSRLAFVAFGAAAVVWAGAAAAEDLTITYKVTRGGAPLTTTQYYSASKIRTSDGERDTILDLAGGKILTIDVKKKEYSEISLQEIETMMTQATAQMEEAMKNVPPAMREQMQKMMGGAGAGAAMADITVAKGGTRTVAGYPCQEYAIAMGQNFKNDTCNTTSVQIPFDPAQFRKLTAFSNPALARNAGKISEQLQKVEGLPLSETMTVSMMGRGMTTTKEATEVKKGAIPASVFEPPAGFKKVDSPMKAMGGKPGRD